MYQRNPDWGWEDPAVALSLGVLGIALLVLIVIVAIVASVLSALVKEVSRLGRLILRGSEQSRRSALAATAILAGICLIAPALTVSQSHMGLVAIFIAWSVLGYVVLMEVLAFVEQQGEITEAQTLDQLDTYLEPFDARLHEHNGVGVISLPGSGWERS